MKNLEHGQVSSAVLLRDLVEGQLWGVGHVKLPDLLLSHPDAARAQLDLVPGNVDIVGVFSRRAAPPVRLPEFGVIVPRGLYLDCFKGRG